MKYPSDLTGIRFSRLVVLRRGSSCKAGSRWVCKCDCGSVVTVQRCALITENTKSCGCLKRDLAKVLGSVNNIKHGATIDPIKLPTYKIWLGMRKRCRDQWDKRYAGRGIKMCERWLNSFDHFYEDMGARPSLKHSIDRKNVNGDYEPSNCRWATVIEQNNNRRNNLIIEYDGKKHSLSEWSRITGIKALTIRYRILRGWLIADALTTPTKGKI